MVYLDLDGKKRKRRKTLESKPNTDQRETLLGSRKSDQFSFSNKNKFVVSYDRTSKIAWTHYEEEGFLKPYSHSVILKVIEIGKATSYLPDVLVYV